MPTIEATPALGAGVKEGAAELVRVPVEAEAAPVDAMPVIELAQPKGVPAGTPKLRLQFIGHLPPGAAPALDRAVVNAATVPGEALPERKDRNTVAAVKARAAQASAARVEAVKASRAATAAGKAVR